MAHQQIQHTQTNGASNAQMFFDKDETYDNALGVAAWDVNV